MDIKSIVVTTLTMFAWREGERLSPGCHEAKEAIACVIRNRVDAGWVNKDWLKIIANTPIHSCSNLAEMDWHSYVDPWPAAYRKIYNFCEDLYGNRIITDKSASSDTRRFNGSMSRGALFYAALQSPVRQWFKENVIDEKQQHPMTITTGLITFFG